MSYHLYGQEISAPPEHQTTAHLYLTAWSNNRQLLRHQLISSPSKAPQPPPLPLPGRRVIVLHHHLLALDLCVQAALGLGGPVLVLQALEAAGALAAVREPHLVVHLAGGLHVAHGGEPHVVQRVVGHVVLAQVGPAVLEGPEGQRVQLGALPDGQGGALGAVVAPAAVDPAVAVVLPERALQGLHLALHVVGVDVLHPVVLAVLLVVDLLGLTVLSVVDLCLKAVVLLNLLQESDGLREQMVGIDENDLDLVDEAGLVDGIEEDAVTRNLGSGEDGAFFHLNSLLQCLSKLGSEEVKLGVFDFLV
mmetsp:Transcript_28926/g.52277  ORF Transcript_28926/g.52277 Transcript_28926/m.52277 type:complete len:306 (-) Transcript_28926:272-1189(-)